jgi:hypothetical protein
MLKCYIFPFSDVASIAASVHSGMKFVRIFNYRNNSLSNIKRVINSRVKVFFLVDYRRAFSTLKKVGDSIKSAIVPADIPFTVTEPVLKSGFTFEPRPGQTTFLKTTTSTKIPPKIILKSGIAKPVLKSGFTFEPRPGQLIPLKTLPKKARIYTKRPSISYFSSETIPFSHKNFFPSDGKKPFFSTYLVFDNRVVLELIKNLGVDSDFTLPVGKVWAAYKLNKAQTKQLLESLLNDSVAVTPFISRLQLTYTLDLSSAYPNFFQRATCEKNNFPCLAKRFRNSITGNFYTDLDLQNCAPVLLLYWANFMGLGNLVPLLTDYAVNRNKILVNNPRWTKSMFFEFIFYPKRKTTEPYFLAFQKELLLITGQVFKNNPNLKDLILKRNIKNQWNVDGVLIAAMTSHMESIVTLTIINYLRYKGWGHLIIWIFDGFLFPNSNEIDISEILASVNEYLFFRFQDKNIVLIEKTLNGGATAFTKEVYCHGLSQFDANLLFTKNNSLSRNLYYTEVTHIKEFEASQFSSEDLAAFEIITD